MNDESVVLVVLLVWLLGPLAVLVVALFVEDHQAQERDALPPSAATTEGKVCDFCGEGVVMMTEELGDLRCNNCGCAPISASPQDTEGAK